MRTSIRVSRAWWGVRGVASALLCSVLVLACDASPADPINEPAWIPLVVAEAWEPVPPDADPFADHAGPDAIFCGERDWRVELGGLEIETTRCNHATVAQPLLTDVAPGDRLRVRVWWQTLVSPEPVEGHLVLAIDEQMVWEERVDIPGPASVREVEVASPVAAAAGAVVTFHLHNHGSNSWNLNELTLYAPAGAGSINPEK